MSTIRPLTAELQKSAIAQVNEVPERVAQDLESLKLWIKQQPHLRARTDDQLLIAFLRGCKFSLEKAKLKIDKFYTLRTKYPEFFNCCDVDKPEFRAIANTGVLCYLPRPLNDNGPRIAFMRSGAYDPDKHKIEDIAHFMHAIQEIALLEDDYLNVHGLIFILDMKGVTIAHHLQMTPTVLKKFTVYSEEAAPLRPKENHFLNPPSWFETIFAIFKPMLSKKQQNRLFVHGNKIELLHKKVPQKYLPKEYGGENGNFDETIDIWNKKFDEYRQYFKDNANYGTDEKLRPGKPIDFDNIFGLDGSFRKLNVD